MDAITELEHCPVCGGTWKPNTEITVHNRCIYYRGKYIPARGMVADMLAILLARKGSVVDRRAMWDIYYADDPNGGAEQKIFDVVIARLRRLIRDNHLPFVIETIYDRGWRLTDAQP